MHSIMISGPSGGAACRLDPQARYSAVLKQPRAKPGIASTLPDFPEYRHGEADRRRR